MRGSVVKKTSFGSETSSTSPTAETEFAFETNDNETTDTANESLLVKRTKGLIH